MKMATHFNRLTPAEAERLALLMEECAEVQQVIGKILRHGYESTHPDSSTTNRELLHMELGDLFASVHLMADNGADEKDVSMDTIEFHKEEKLGRIGKYLHHQTNET
jgi:NTP pyrophosphatase (non-canonical NTP hydrolase)